MPQNTDSEQRSARRRFTACRDIFWNTPVRERGREMGLAEKKNFQAVEAESSADHPGSSEARTAPDLF